MKTLTLMKNVCNLNRFFLLVMALGLVTTFTACDNDDNKSEIPVYSLKDVEGSYTGKMLTIAPTPQTLSTGEPQGIDVTAKLENGNVVLEKFPVDDLIKGIITNEQEAEAIIKAIGDINYKIAYNAAFNEGKDSIYLQMNPEPMEIKFKMPATEEGGEDIDMNIKATIASEHKGNFAYENKKLKFSLQATKIDVNDAALELPTTTFNFNLNKK